MMVEVGLMTGNISQLAGILV